MPLGNSAPANFRVFAESRAADPAGLPEPWSWSDGLAAFIANVWTWHPEHAPEDRRDEFEERRRDAHTAMTAEVHAEQTRQEANAW